MDIAIIFSLGALICGATGLLIAIRILRSPPSWLPDMAKGLMKPGYLGKEIRAAYPPEMVVEMACAMINFNKPSMMNFLEKEGIPLMAAIGGAEVADDARLAKAAKSLGGGAGGLQGIQKVVGLLGSSKKGGGLGDIMAIANSPIGQKFLGGMMNNNGGPNDGPSSSPPSSSQSQPSLGKPM